MNRLSICLFMAVTFSLAGCASDNDSAPETDTGNGADDNTEALIRDVKITSAAGEENGRTLINPNIDNGKFYISWTGRDIHYSIIFYIEDQEYQDKYGVPGIAFYRNTCITSTTLCGAPGKFECSFSTENKILCKPEGVNTIIDVTALPEDRNIVVRACYYGTSVCTYVTKPVRLM